MNQTKKAWWRNRSNQALLVFLAIGGYFLWIEHQAHVIAALPFLLVGGCLIMHLFMHGGHGHGRHMAHGHGAAHGSENPDTHSDIDPVCGEEVASTEGYGKMHSDRLYRFCSRRCLDAFDAHPELYVNEQKEVTS